MLLSLSFAMPSSPIELYITLWNGAPGQGEAYYRGYVGPYPVVLTMGQWVTLSKPQSWRNVLEGGALNIERGEWLNWSVFVVPPWSFTPGKWIERTIDWLADGLNNVINLTKELWDAQWQQNLGLAGMIRSFTEDLTELRNLFQDLDLSTDGILNRIWQGLQKIEAFAAIVKLYNLLAEFLPESWAELRNFLTNPVDYWFDRLDEWLNEEA
jgi:hypothetical protein